MTRPVIPRVLMLQGHGELNETETQVLAELLIANNFDVQYFSFADKDVTLQPDDLLVMASDGALACGEAAFTRAVLALQQDAAPRMAAVLLAACASARPEDDSTVLLVRITRAAGGTVQDRQTDR